MSWDLILQNTPVSADSDGLPDAGSAPPLGTADAVRTLISSVHRNVDWSDPAWGTLESDGWSIEFNVGDSEIIGSIMLHVRGSGDPLPAIVALCTNTGWRALDLSSGEFLDPGNPSPRSWLQFQNFRDSIQAFAVVRDPSTLRRSRLRLEETTLVRLTDRAGDERYELGAFSEVLFERGTNWASVGLAIAALGLAISFKIVIPMAWLGWLLGLVFTVLGFLFTITARTDVLVLKMPSRNIVLPLLDTADEHRAFKEALLAALNASRHRSPMSPR